MRIAVASLVLLAAGGARASTLGLPPCTPSTIELPLGHVVGEGPQLVVARTPAEAAPFFRRVVSKTPIPTPDFTRDMLVAVVAAKRAPLVIYRVTVDDAAHPTVLEVHLAEHQVRCAGGPRDPAFGAYAVYVPRSALPVRFVVDRMIDGRMYVADPDSLGFDQVILGELPGIAAPAALPVVWREQAEQRAAAVLTVEERKRLLVGPLGRVMTRIPHAWTRLGVTRDARRWNIRWEDIVLQVDVATGLVARRR
jgi:hypothetical protein